LSRNEIGQALPLFLGVLNSGIEIVTRTPELHFTKSSVNDIGNIMLAIIELGRAYSESAAKVMRGRDSWTEKRRLAKDQRVIISRRCPAWLSVSADGKRFVVNKAAVKVIVWILEQVVAGLGVPTITRMLNEQHKPIGRKPYWNQPYVQSLIKNRELLGEYQPHEKTAGKRHPIGEPIPNYFPAVVPEDLFYRAQKAVRSRITYHGRKGHQVNLFTRLLFAPDGSALVINDKGQGKKLVAQSAIRGQGKWVSFPLDVFERCFLECLRNIQLADKSPQQGKLDAMEERLTGLQDKIAKVKQRIESEQDTDELLDLLATLNASRKRIESEIDILRTEQYTAVRVTLKQAHALWKRLQAEGGDELRERLRTLLRQVVRRIMVDVEAPTRYSRVATLSVEFHDGTNPHLRFSVRGQGKHRSFTGVLIADRNEHPAGTQRKSRRGATKT
jgi:hypothetical protein